ncbi:MAG: glycosyltransferase family 2 protein [Ilumatobacteraceae bacterium]
MISAVIPAYNRAELLGRAIESALTQTRPPAEIIVSDDGSTDNTEEVASRYPVTYVRQANQGASEARNFGVRHASQPWIAFLDSDDYWMPDHLERLGAACDATEGSARFYFDDLVRDVGGVPTSHWERCEFSIEGDWKLVDNAGDWVMLPRQPSMLQCSLIDREWYEREGGLWKPLGIRHDNHIFMRLGLRGPACAVSGVGTRMTDDDAAETRVFATGLTNGPGSHKYAIETVLMYEDLLRTVPEAAPEHRTTMVRRFSNGNFKIARAGIREHRWGLAAKHLAAGCYLDPRGSLERVTNRVRRRNDEDG